MLISLINSFPRYIHHFLSSIQSSLIHSPDSLIDLAAKIVITYATLGEEEEEEETFITIKLAEIERRPEPSASSTLSKRTVRRAALTAASDSALESVLAPSRPPLLPPPLQPFSRLQVEVANPRSFSFFFFLRSALLPLLSPIGHRLKKLDTFRFCHISMESRDRCNLVMNGE